MKKLFLLRHAKASHDPSFISDIERPLTERGHHDARLISGRMQKENLAPALIITSPAIRTYSTALLCASVFEINEASILLEKNLYNSSVNEYLDVISELDNHKNTVLLVGHNDTISETAGKLLHDKQFESLPTCGLAVLSSPAKTWESFVSMPATLDLLWYPSMFKSV